MPQPYCDSCLLGEETRLATTHSTHPEWSGYAFCEECAREYSDRPLTSTFPALETNKALHTARRF